MSSKVYKQLFNATLFSAALVTSTTTLAHSEGDVFARIGFGTVLPNESSDDPNNIGELQLDNVTNLAGTVTYMTSDKMGVEALLGLPFTHEVSTDDHGVIGEVSHLPLSVTA